MWTHFCANVGGCGYGEEVSRCFLFQRNSRVLVVSNIFGMFNPILGEDEPQF